MTTRSRLGASARGTARVPPPEGSGAQGAQGATGSQGAQGFQGGGSQGAQGFQGSIGAQGATGTQGFQGAQGVSLPAVGVTDAGDRLAVSALGVWGTAANGFLVFATIALRDAYPGLRTEGMVVYVQNTSCLYVLQSDLTTWNIIANNGLGKQAAWFIDVASGNDSNDGKSSGTALASTQEFMARCFPGGQQLKIEQNTTVNIAAGTYLRLSLNLTAVTPITPFTQYAYNVNCAVTSSAAMVLNSVTSQSGTTSTRGEIVVASGALTAKERIRATTGAAAGSMCYSTGLVSATDSFTSTWCKPTFANFHSAPEPVAGDSVVVDTLTVTLNRVEVHAAQGVQLVINDAKIVRVGVAGDSNSASGSTDAGGNVMFSGCQFTSAGPGSISCISGAYLCACRITATAKVALVGANWNIVALCVQGVFRVSGQAQSQGICIDGGNLEVGTIDGTIGEAAPSILTTWADFGTRSSGIEVENGNGVYGATYGAINVWPGARLLVETGTYWGASTAYAIGIQIAPGAWLETPVLVTITSVLKFPSTVNQLIASLPFAYSDTPIVLGNSNCGVIQYSTIAGAGVNATDGVAYLVAQNANVAATNFIASAAKGLYRFAGYIAVTTNDAGAAGAPVLSAIFTDDSGVARTVVVATGTALTTLGGGGGVVELECNGATPIQYSITGVVTPAAARFSARIRCTLESAGA